jgi:hypothetical protein
MRAYLLYSSSAHFVLLAFIFLGSLNSFGSKKTPAYYIDFIGPASVVTMAKAVAAEDKTGAPLPKAAQAAKKPDEDDFSSSALPKPSILSSGARLFDE